MLDGCRKWRVLPFQSSTIGQEPPENWICSMNPDTKHNKCQCAEEKPSIPLGEFKKETKSIEQKRAEKEEKLMKMQRELDKMSVCSLGRICQIHFTFLVYSCPDIAIIQLCNIVTAYSMHTVGFLFLWISYVSLCMLCRRKFQAKFLPGWECLISNSHVMEGKSAYFEWHRSTTNS